MNDDPLELALAALRGGAAPDPGETRARVLRSIRSAAHLRRAWTAAGLVALLALAVEVGRATAPGRADDPREELPGTTEVVVVDVPVVVPLRFDVPGTRVVPSVRPDGRGSAGTLETELPLPTAAEPDTPALAALPEDPELVAFAAAYRQTFDVGPDGVALARWQDYLTRWPDGRFAPEATWNAAYCLRRLGRGDEAEPLLRRIAGGTLGPAHVADAERLLERDRRR